MLASLQVQSLSVSFWLPEKAMVLVKLVLLGNLMVPAALVVLEMAAALAGRLSAAVAVDVAVAVGLVGGVAVGFAVAFAVARAAALLAVALARPRPRPRSSALFRQPQMLLLRLLLSELNDLPAWLKKIAIKN
jgi:hypothetical protein